MQTRQGIIEAEVSRLIILRWNWITEKPSKLRMILMPAAFLDNFLPNHTRFQEYVYFDAGFPLTV